MIHPDILSDFSFNLDLIMRILVSVALGFMVGMERELTNKSAGLRTHILVCLGSTVFTILSIYGFNTVQTIDGVRILNDPARIAAQILTGIGFIGGGAVLHHGVSVYGLTTAATLWMTASIGMAIGTGHYAIAVISAILTLMVLILIRRLERGVLARHIQKGARIKATIVTLPDNISDLQDWFFKHFENIAEMSIGKATRDDNMSKIIFTIDVVDKDPISKTYKKIKELKNIESLTLQHVVEGD